MEKAIFDRNLQYINSNLPKELETALMKLITGIHEDKYGGVGEDSSTSRGKRDDGNKILKSRQAIREKAMRQDVKPVRHLVHTTTSNTSTVTSDSPNNEENKAGPSKTTKQSPKKKKSLTRSERKRRIPISPRAIKKNRIRIKVGVDKHSSSENDEAFKSDTDVNENLEKSEDNDNKPVTSTSDTIQAVAVDMQKKGKGKKTVVDKERENKELCKENNKMMKTENQTERSEDQKIVLMETEEDNEHELDIKIDTLPVLIRTEEQGRLFEIEIIDNQIPAVNLTKKPRSYKKKESALKKLSSMPGVSIEKIADPAAAIAVEPVASTSAANQYATITEITKKSKKDKDETAKTAQDKQGICIPSSKLDKRDRKRVHIQSKFKRLGMLPVANFNVVDDAEVVSDDNDSNDGTQEKIGLATIED